MSEHAKQQLLSTIKDSSCESAKITVKFKKGDTKILAAKFANLKRYKRVT